MKNEFVNDNYIAYELRYRISRKGYNSYCEGKK